jgi:hypothetical protein
MASNNILTAKVTIQGTRALLWHAFGPDALPLEKQERTGVAGNDPVEWQRTVLMTPDRQLYLKPTYIFGCLRDGAKYTARKRGTLQPWIAATLQILDDLILIDGRTVPEEPVTQDPTAPVFLDIQGVRNPSTKARNVRYRIGTSSGWTCSFNILWDKTIINRNEMEAVIIDAGRLTGLGDGRSVGYGRFQIQNFEVENA